MINGIRAYDNYVKAGKSYRNQVKPQHQLQGCCVPLEMNELILFYLKNKK